MEDLNLDRRKRRKIHHTPEHDHSHTFPAAQPYDSRTREYLSQNGPLFGPNHRSSNSNTPPTLNREEDTLSDRSRTSLNQDLTYVSAEYPSNAGLDIQNEVLAKVGRAFELPQAIDVSFENDHHHSQLFSDQLFNQTYDVVDDAGQLNSDHVLNDWELAPSRGGLDSDTLIQTQALSSIAIQAPAVTSTATPTLKVTKTGPDKNWKCTPCIKYKKRCVPSEQDPSICEECFKKRRLVPVPCLSLKEITAIYFYRRHTDPIMKLPYCELGIHAAVRWVRHFISYSTSRTFTIVRHNGPELKLEAAKFILAPQMLARLPEKTRKLLKHPYMLSVNAPASYGNYVLRYIKDYLLRSIPESDPLTRAMFEYALKKYNDRRHIRKPNILVNTIRLFATARMVEGGWYIRNPERLSLPVDLSSSDATGSAPLTSAGFIDYQFSGIIAALLGKLRKLILEAIQDKMKAPSKSPENDWMSTFISCFILLYSLRLSALHLQNFAKRTGKRSHRDTRSYPDLIEAKDTIYTHFHSFICPSKVAMPFSTDWDSKKIDRFRHDTRMADDDFAFLQFFASNHTKAKIMTGEFARTAASDDIFADHWFTCQLFLPRSKT